MAASHPEPAPAVSPAFNYHNRFAAAEKPADTSAADDSNPNSSSSFNFDFGEFKSLDTDGNDGLGSFLGQYTSSKGPASTATPAPAPAPAPSTAPAPPTFNSISAPAVEASIPQQASHAEPAEPQQSRDVAALEAAVAHDEEAAAAPSQPAAFDQFRSSASMYSQDGADQQQQQQQQSFRTSPVRPSRDLPRPPFMASSLSPPAQESSTLPASQPQASFYSQESSGSAQRIPPVAPGASADLSGAPHAQAHPEPSSQPQGSAPPSSSGHNDSAPQPPPTLPGSSSASIHDAAPATQAHGPAPVSADQPSSVDTDLASRMASSLDVSSEQQQHSSSDQPAQRGPLPTIPPPQAQSQTSFPSTDSGLTGNSQSSNSHYQPQGMRRPSNDASNQQHQQYQQERERPNSFFGMERPLAAVNASGQTVPLSSEYGATSSNAPADDSGSGFFPGVGSREGAGGNSAPGTRPSSFFHTGPNDPRPSGDLLQQGQGESQAARIAAQLRKEALRQESMGTQQTRSTLAGGTGNAYISQSNSFATGMPNGRPASIAASMSSGPLLDHSHLKPGQQAALLSHNKTLELYRQNAKKTNDPDLIYEFAVFMIDASKTMTDGPSSGPNSETTSKEEIIKEAVGLLKKIAERGHPDAQYFLADCYANGIGTPKGKQDFDRAYPLFVLAAKHGHPDAAYRAGTCYEKGWGCRRDSGKALQFYRKASSQSHPGAMYRLATAELNGELGLKKSPKEGVKWLKRSAENATPEFPHALHELALLHERGIDNVLFVDPEYACELLAQAGEMGYAPSAYKLGVNYEYGRMGCPQDAGLSIHMYNIAAQQNHKEACFALTAWYLVGAPGILPQSDTEAYLWAKKAAEQGLAKAEYAVGYFTEMGIGTVKDLREAKAWFTKAAEHGDKRANQRLTALGARPVQTLAGVGAGANGKDKDKGAPKAGQHGQSAAGTDYASMPQARRTQPTNAPFPSRVEVSAMSPAMGGGGTSYPSPLTMRDQQSAQREERYLANVAAHQQAQLRASMSASAALNGSNGSASPLPASQSAAAGQRPSYSSGMGPVFPQQSSASPTPRAGPTSPTSPAPPMSPPVHHPMAAKNGMYAPSTSSSGGSGSAHGPAAGASAGAAYPSYPAGQSASTTTSPRMGGGVPLPQGHYQMSPPQAQQRPDAMQSFGGAGTFAGGNSASPYGSPSQGPGSGMAQGMSMPLGLNSDDAAAAQIAQRAARQQGEAAGGSPAGGEAPKKKKGWFR